MRKSIRGIVSSKLFNNFNKDQKDAIKYAAELLFKHYLKNDRVDIYKILQDEGLFDGTNIDMAVDEVFNIYIEFSEFVGEYMTQI